MNRMFLSINNIELLTKLVFSIIFALSAIGKLIDPVAAALSLSRLFYLSPEVAQTAVILFSIIEIGIAVLVWWAWTARFILIIPLLFIGVLIHSYFQGIDCGCFGSLPFLSQFSISGHILLLIGMILSLWFLAKIRRCSSHKNSTQNSVATLQWLGIVGLAMILFSFATIPLSQSGVNAEASSGFPIVSREEVKENIETRESILIDARTEFEYEIDHIESAISIPYDTGNLPELIDKYDLRSNSIIVYCTSADCDAAEVLATKLHALDCKNLSIYSGGWEDWIFE